jgi:predicted transcriptional regulator
MPQWPPIIRKREGTVRTRPDSSKARKSQANPNNRTRFLTSSFLLLSLCAAVAVSSDTRNVKRAFRGCYLEREMSTLQEIKSAIANLSAHDKALLTAELFAVNTEPDNAALEDALDRGLKDVEAGRVRPVEEVKAMIPRWTSKS